MNPFQKIQDLLGNAVAGKPETTYNPLYYNANGQPKPAPKKAVPLKEGVDVVKAHPALQSAIETAYKQNPKMPRGTLEALTMQESSMGTNKTKYNPRIGTHAWVFGMTPIAQKELARNGIQTDLNTLGGAARAAAAYLSLSQNKYSDPATWYKQGYNQNPSAPFNADKFSSMVDYYAKGGTTTPTPSIKSSSGLALPTGQ